MNFFFHHVAQRLVDHLMPLDSAFSLKLWRNNGNGKMAAAAFRTFMTGMKVAVIAHFDCLWREGFTQAPFNEGRAPAAVEILLKLHRVCICVVIRKIVHSGGRERLAALAFMAAPCETA